MAKQGETDPDSEQRRGKEKDQKVRTRKEKEGLGERKGKDWIHHI